MSYLSLRDVHSGTIHEYQAEEVRVGRDPGCDWVVSGTNADVVSGYHVRFFVQDEKWWVEDVGSRNGSSLNEQHLSHLKPHPVVAGSIVGLGDRGPRLRVEATEKKKLANTVVEPQRAVRSSAPTMPLEALNASTLPMDRAEPNASITEIAPAMGVTPAIVPPPPAIVEIEVVMHDTRSGAKHQAKGKRIRMGRGHECELHPVATGDNSVSRVHAEIVLLNGEAVLRDAKSRNGTFVDGKLLVGDHVLKPGEKITLGEGGPDLMIDQLMVPGSPVRVPAQSTARTSPDDSKAPVRRSFAGKGKTLFFREMMEESQQKSARRLRWVVWSFVAVLSIIVGGFYWFTEERERVTASALAEQRKEMLAQQAQEDSVRRVAAADYERLRQQLDSARNSAAPAVVLDSLRQALAQSTRRTEALEGALKRAQAQMADQLSAGDSIRRTTQAELTRLKAQLTQAASQSDGGSALLDSLRNAAHDAERKMQSVDAQMRALKGVNLPALAQSAGGAVGLVTAYTGADIFDGSGFVITRAGHFVTNRHVVEPEGKVADSVFVTMSDQKFMVHAEVISVAPTEGPDVAVIKIRGYRGPVVPRVDWTGGHARQGEPAALIGFPAGASLALDASGKVQTSMSSGIFSKVTPERIQFDGFTVGGSSGSPIFNADGEVVALHRSGLKEAAGLGFAVPISQLIPYIPPDAKAELGLH
jgi:pSer/pThr/pTyr-binding forkhead associated (FHA) protein/S1-C subfamily serine protease